MDDLQSPVDLLPGERGAQNCMAIHNSLPGLCKNFDLEGAMQSTGQLLKIDACLRCVQAVKEHPFLHRTQRINILNVTHTARNGCDKVIDVSLG